MLLPAAVVVAQNADAVKAPFRAGKITEARRTAEEWLKSEPSNPDAHYWMAVVLQHREVRDLETATEHIEEAVDRVPNNADYQFMLGGIYGQTAQSAGMIKQALLAPKIKRAFARAVELNPEHVEARIALAQYYLMAPGFMGGDEDEGFRQLDEAAKRNEPRGRMAKAAMLERKNRLAESESEWKLLATKYPEDWIPHKNLGYFLLRRNRAEEGLKPMQRYVALRPDTADAFDSLGELQLAAGRVDEAITTLRKGLVIDPTFGSSWFLLGQAHERKKQPAEAKSAYLKVVENDRNEQLKKQATERLKHLP
jgi:tetratricopeptide (TPR) repeat protein